MQKSVFFLLSDELLREQGNVPLRTFQIKYGPASAVRDRLIAISGCYRQQNFQFRPGTATFSVSFAQPTIPSENFVLSQAEISDTTVPDGRIQYKQH